MAKYRRGRRMHKTIIDCGRHGGHVSNVSRYNRQNVPREDREALPKKESMRKRHGWESKYACDNLTPLRRFIEKNLGRPWDDVYSELVADVPKGLHRFHLDTHIRQYVDVFGETYRSLVWHLYVIDEDGLLQKR